MRYLKNKEIIEISKSDVEEKCQHVIIPKIINGVKYRCCKHCDIIAHSDGDFSYSCGNKWCRCSN